jgi:hypothetical protein
MALEKLAMVQHWDRFHHAIIQGCGYWPWIHIFESKDYGYIQQTTLTTLEVIVGCVILHV